MEDLRQKLKSMDGKGYKAYKGLEGEYRFPGYTFFIDHVQGDPFAEPSKVRVKICRDKAGFPADTTSSRSRTIALCDYLTRRFHDLCLKIVHKGRGIGKSGLIAIDKPVQEVLARTSMTINSSFVEARFFIGLPAFGRQIAARVAMEMIFGQIPGIVDGVMFMGNLDKTEVYRAIETAEDADFIRNRLESRNLVAFVANGARLARRSGIDPSPMDGEDAIPFVSPSTFEVSFDLPNGGRLTGMGIPKGVTLIVGGGFHGKSTLLNALEFGVYNHIPGDGREFALSLSNAVKIRAADGRSISATDISPFINTLPLGRETVCFSTGNASGSTSQAAAITEAIEAGTGLLLLDEDTSATNFMIRDHRMQALVSRAQEPITPFIDKVRQLYREKGISTILVMGGSGDYFQVADHVIQMAEYLPLDVTQKARHIAQTLVTGREQEGGASFGKIRDRIPEKKGVNPKRGSRERIKALGTRKLLFGNQEINFWDVEQVVDISQARSMVHALKFAATFMDGRRTLKEVTDLMLARIKDEGLEILLPFLSGDLAEFRANDFMAVVNRMRSLQVTQKTNINTTQVDDP